LADSSKRSCWRCTLIGLGIPITLIALCCCFDADATVWRLVDDDAAAARAAAGGGGAPLVRHATLGDGGMERVALRELALGDSVLTVDPWTREPAWEPIAAKARTDAVARELVCHRATVPSCHTSCHSAVVSQCQRANRVVVP
jgi:hypothetical protein